MQLSKPDAELFFELTTPLHFFVNQQLHVLSDVHSLQDYVACELEQQLQVRNALYQNIELIDAFIEKNPNDFPADKLAIIAEWKHFVAGDFYIERLLKKYAIFISSDDKVYAVLALNNPFQEMFHPSQLPFLVKAVLLPFKGKIIYDGLFEGYNVFFGRGISSELKETYMAAKQHDRIILSLSPDWQPTQAKQRRQSAKDWRPVLDELMAHVKKLRGSSGQPAIVSPAFALVRGSVALAQSAVEAPDDLERLWELLRKVERAMNQVETTLYRAERFD